MGDILLNGRVPADSGLPAIARGRRCERSRDLEQLAEVLTEDPAPRHEGRPVTGPDPGAGPVSGVRLRRGVVPPGTYAGGGRSPIVYVLLCAPCAGYAPITDEEYDGFLSGPCQGCGAGSREVHRFQALILSAASGGCMCDSGHPPVTGDLPTRESAVAVMLEVRTRPGAKS